MPKPMCNLSQGVKAEGINIGEMRMLVKQVRKGRVTIEEAAEDAGMTVEEFLIFGFTVFIAMNQLFDIALLFQGSGSYAFYGIPVLADNTNQVGERFLIYTNRIDKVDTAVDDSDLIAGCNIQSTHLLYNSVAL